MQAAPTGLFVVHGLRAVRHAVLQLEGRHPSFAALVLCEASGLEQADCVAIPEVSSLPLLVLPATLIARACAGAGGASTGALHAGGLQQRRAPAHAGGHAQDGGLRPGWRPTPRPSQALAGAQSVPCMHAHRNPMHRTIPCMRCPFTSSRACDAACCSGKVVLDVARAAACWPCSSLGDA